MSTTLILILAAIALLLVVVVVWRVRKARADEAVQRALAAAHQSSDWKSSHYASSSPESRPSGARLAQ